METYCCKLGLWKPWGPLIKQFGDSIVLLDALARYSVSFSHIGHVTMAAKATDSPMGGLGRVEEAKNGLTGGNTTGAGLFCLRGKCLLHFHSNSCCSHIQ